MTYGLLLLVFIVTGENDSLENSLIGQFAVTSNDSIVYLDNRGGWHSIDSFIDESHIFIITAPLIRYDTMQTIRYNPVQAESIDSHPYMYGLPQIISDTVRVIYKELSVVSAFEIMSMQIRCIKDVSIGYININIPRGSKLHLLSGVEASASIMLLIDTLGDVIEEFILESSGFTLWNDVAFNTVRKGEFKPIRINGKPEKAWIIIPTGNDIESVRVQK
ncbi:MAG: energy transducer TonB [bacterium]